MGSRYQPASCGYCEQELEEITLERYWAAREELCSLLISPALPAPVLYAALARAGPALHPYDLTFISALQATLAASLQEEEEVRTSYSMFTVLCTVLAAGWDRAAGQDTGARHRASHHPVPPSLGISRTLRAHRSPHFVGKEESDTNTNNQQIVVGEVG